MRRPDYLIKLAVFFVFILAVCLSQNAQTSEKADPDDPDRRQAMELFNQGKFVDATPLFEKLTADHPSDYAAREGWAWCLMEYAATLPVSELRKKVRIRARAIAQQAKQLGDNSQLLQVVLEIPEDGSELAFSERKDIDEAMKAAEADFARGDLDKAREGYLRVLLIDPNYYEASLFIGDVYFKQHVYGSACEWFARATQIDPNRETAYRYWGDTLVAMNKDDEARAQFIQAVIAEPYNRTSWAGLSNWSRKNNLPLNVVQLKDQSSISVTDATHVSVNVDPSLAKDDPNNLAWTSYGMTRATWRVAFSKRFPSEPKYRRTLTEESESLTVMIRVLKDQKDYQQKYKDLNPALQSLIKIQEAGFLDPFVLLNRVNPEIAHDYEPYRKTNRELIRRYLDEFVVPKIPADKK